MLPLYGSRLTAGRQPTSESRFLAAGGCIVRNARHEAWMMDGELHRADGPALIYTTGTREWWRNGLRHRADGPAVIYRCGAGEWWWRGELVPDEL